jgi:hypothetical protein
MFEYGVESANLHLDIDRNQLDIWVCRTGLGIGLHLVKVLFFVGWLPGCVHRRKSAKF